MNQFKQSDLKKEKNGSHSTFYQNQIHFKEKESAFIEEYKCSAFSLVFVIKPGVRMTEIFSVGPHKIDKGLKA